MSTTDATPPHHSHRSDFDNDPALRELAMIRTVMGALLAAERYDLEQVIVGNFDYREAVLQDSPGSRSKRLIVPRYGQGADNLAVTTAPVQVLEKSEGRLGGTIVNAGANAVILYLATLGDIQGGQLHARPAVWLAASGGTWNFRLGNILYGGTVCAAAAAATSTLTIAEF